MITNAHIVVEITITKAPQFAYLDFQKINTMLQIKLDVIQPKECAEVTNLPKTLG